MGYVSTLKIDRASFETLAEVVGPWDTEEHREMYRTGQFPRAEHTRDLDMRYRWDLYWAARSGLPEGFRSGLYDAGVNDNHFDSALKRIVPKL